MTSIYYKPGYFDAKLVVNDEVVKEDALLIPSKGWVALLETEKIPIYFPPQDFQNEEGIALLPESIQSNNLHIPDNEVVVNYYWVEDFKSLTLADFRLETTLKSIPFGLSNSCQRVEIILLCEGQAIIIPLSIKGCVADLDLFFLDKTIDGNRNDLSKFGVDVNDWVTIKMTSNNQTFSIFLEDELVYEVPTLGRNNKVYRVKYRFQGTGAIGGLTISNREDVFLDE